MKTVLLVALFLLAITASAQRRPSPRPLPVPSRLPEFYTTASGAPLGLWWNGGYVWVLGCCNGLPVERGAQVVLKGKNFAGKPGLVELRYSHSGEIADVIYLLPRLEFDVFPVGLESCGITLPPMISGRVQARLLTNGTATNEISFEIR